MTITNKLLQKIFGIKNVPQFSCRSFGKLNSDQKDILTYLDNEKFIDDFNKNPNVSAVLITPNIAKKILKSKVKKVICDDPGYYFYTLYNYLAYKNYKKKKSIIHSTVKIDKTAYINDYNVQISKNTIIEPNVTILPDVIIGNNCIIRAGSVLGAEGFEYKKTKKGIIHPFHDGKVIIGNNVHIGCNNTISKGFFGKDTIIGDDTKTDNLVHIAHCDWIGKKCIITPGVIFAGSVTVKDNSFIGLGANVSQMVRIDENAFISIGAVVTKNVDKNQQVTGNFAIPHQKFINNLKKSLQ